MNPEVLLLFLLSAFTPNKHTDTLDVQSHEFIGTIQLMDKSIISYKLLFDEAQNGSITGSSITDFAGDHRTESEIVGQIDHDNNTITYREIRDISTKSDMPSDDFCYVHLTNAKIKLKKNKSIIQGHFNSYYLSGDECVEGDIYLMSDDFFNKKLRQVERNVKRFAPKDNKKATLTMLEESKKAMSESLVVKDDEILSLSTAASTVTIKVWDDQFVDDDKISIHVNGLSVVEGHVVTDVIKTFVIDLPSDTTDLVISADNEGRFPPNSSKVALVNDDEEIPVSVRLLTGKSATFRFIHSDTNGETPE